LEATFAPCAADRSCWRSQDAAGDVLDQGIDRRTINRNDYGDANPES
jgi:hypothetical protein